VIRTGVVLFGIGVVCTIVAMLPLVLPVPAASILWFLAMLMGVGFLLILLGLLGNARRRSREVRTRLAASTDG
jgi:hypothetical protein